MLTSSLACGPMSQEVIEAVFRHSHKFGKRLMLICSRNQVDVDYGYVFTTRQYMDYIEKMKRKYPRSSVVICRDHCGPGFGSDQPLLTTSDTLESVKDTIRCDLENGFDFIHIDLCHNMEWCMSHSEKLQRTKELMQFAIDIKPDVMFEIGTDENIGKPETNIDRIVADIRACQEVANPVFYVVQTGSFVRAAYQAGSFKADNVRTMCKALHDCGTKLKEHNADYLTTEQIITRNGVVDAINIAPQLGVVQTSHILSQSLIYGIDTKPFMNKVVHCGKWKKWIDNDYCDPDYYLCALVAGHYHFDTPVYKRLIEELSRKTNIRKNIISEITKVIEHYLFAME